MVVSVSFVQAKQLDAEHVTNDVLGHIAEQDGFRVGCHRCHVLVYNVFVTQNRVWLTDGHSRIPQWTRVAINQFL